MIINNLPVYPLSYSQLDCFMQCPIKHYLRYNEKIPQSPSIHLEKGKLIHSILEDYFNEKQNDKSDDYKEIVKIAEKLKQRFEKEKFKVFVESKIAFDKTMNYTENQNPWIRGYCDLYAIKDNYAIVIDWKSGKSKEEQYVNWKQLDLYSLAVFQKHPEIKNIEQIYCYVEHNNFLQKDMKRDDDLRINLMNDYLYFENASKKENVKNHFNNNKPKKWMCDWCDYKNICDKRID